MHLAHVVDQAHTEDHRGGNGDAEGRATRLEDVIEVSEHCRREQAEHHPGDHGDAADVGHRPFVDAALARRNEQVAP